MLAKDLKEILYLQKRLDIKHRKRWDPRLEQTKTHKDPIVDDAPPLVLLRSTGMQPSPLLQWDMSCGPVDGDCVAYHRAQGVGSNCSKTTEMVWFGQLWIG